MVRFGGTTDYRVASNAATRQAIDFYHDVGEDKSWYVYRSNKHTSRVVNTLDEAIELWNQEEPESKLGAVDVMQQQKPKSGNNLAKLISNLKF